MAVVAHALTNRAKVKSYLGITDASNDSLLEELIDNVTEWVEGQLGGRRIKETPYVDEEHDGGEQDIFLNNWPVKATPTLTASFRTGTIESPIFQDFTANDFIVYNNAGFVHFFARTPGGERVGAHGIVDVPRFHGEVTKGSLNLRFTYTAGFATIPDDLELLAKQLVATLFQRRNAQGIKKETVEGSSIEYRSPGDENEGLSIEGLTGVQKAVIDRYTRHNVGQNF